MTINCNPILRYTYILIIFIFIWVGLASFALLLYVFSTENVDMETYLALIAITILALMQFVFHAKIVLPLICKKYSKIIIKQNGISSEILFYKPFSSSWEQLHIIADHVPRGANGLLTIGFSKAKIDYIDSVDFWSRFNSVMVKTSEMLILRLSPKEFEEVLSFCPKEKIVDLYPSFKERYMRDGAK